MALRPENTDFLHNFRFYATAVDAAAANRLSAIGRPGAGFSTCSAPEATVEVAEYKEGDKIYKIKQPGNVTFNDITLARGVARSDSAFWDWLRVVIEGTGEYRVTLTITQWHRVEALTRIPNPDPLAVKENVGQLNLDAAGIEYRLYDAFPIRHKFATDFDATSSDISLGEIDVSYERCETTHLAPPAA